MLFHIFCNHLAVKQIDNAVSIIRIIRGVCNHDDGRTLLIQLGQKLHYLFSIGRIQITGRFIRQYNSGLCYNRAGDGDALLLTT